MLNSRMRLLIVSAAVLLPLCAGCSGGPKIPTTVSVSGKVMYKDKPVDGALIGFVSKLDNVDVFPAHGTTDANGEFTLATYIDPEHEVSGATPGEFTVTVTKNTEQDMAKIMEEFKTNPAMQFKKAVPEKYTADKTSPLSATVKADGTNNFEFTLED